MLQDQTIEKTLVERFMKITKENEVAASILTLSFAIQNSPIGRTDSAQTALEKLVPKTKE